MKKLLLLLIGMILLGGCWDEQTTTNANVSKSTTQQIIPGESSYTGEGYSVERNITSWGLFHASPDIKELKVDVGKTKPVSISPGAINAQGSSGGSIFSRGISTGLISQMVAKIKQIIAVYVVLVIVALVLYFIPQTSAIGGLLLRGLFFFVPWVGTAIENRVAAARQRYFAQVVAGGQEFKNRVNSDPEFDEIIKQKIKKLFTDAMMNRQDITTQRRVKEIKIKQKS